MEDGGRSRRALRRERQQRYEAEAAAQRRRRQREAAEQRQRLDAELARDDEAARVRPLDDQKKLTRWAYAHWIGGAALLAFVWDEVPWWIGVPAWPAVFAWLGNRLRRMAGVKGYACVFSLLVIAVPGVIYSLEPARSDIMLQLTGERAAVEVKDIKVHVSSNPRPGGSWTHYTFRYADTGRPVPGPPKTGTMSSLRRQVFERNTTYIMLVDSRGKIQPQTLGHASPLAELVGGGLFLLLGCATIRRTSRKANPAFAKAARPLVPEGWRPRIGRYAEAQAQRRARRRAAYATPQGRRRWSVWAHVSGLAAYGTGVALWWVSLSAEQRVLLYAGLCVVLLAVVERAVRSWVQGIGLVGWLATCMLAGGHMSHTYGVDRGSPDGAAICAGVFLVLGHLAIWPWIRTANTPAPTRRQ